MKTNFPTLEILKNLGLSQKKIFQSIKKKNFLLKSISTTAKKMSKNNKTMRIKKLNK